VAGVAINVEVNRLGSNTVGTSWPPSARKLAAPMPFTRGLAPIPFN
jgi:hypothetical protein